MSGDGGRGRGLTLYFLHEDAGVAAAAAEFVETGGWEPGGVDGGVAEFAFEEVVGLGTEGEDGGEAEVAGAAFCELDESAAEAHAFVGFADVEAADFCHGLVWPWLDGDDGDDGAVDFHDVVAVDGGADFVAGASDEFVVGDGGADHADDGVDVVAAGWADALIGVAVDHGADAFDAEEFTEECVVGAAVEEVDARDPAFAGACGVAEEEDLAAFGFSGVGASSGEGAGFVDGELADAAVFGVFDDACADEEELGGVEGDGDFDGDSGGVEAERAALAFAAAGRDERGDALVDELLERLGVDAVDGAGVAEVEAADDACWVD